MKTKLLLLAFCIFLGALQAQDFTINSVNYTVIDATNNYVTVARNAGFAGNLTLPSTVDYTENGSTITYTVTKINAQAFQSTSITSITIPNSVTVIGEQAFSYCSALTNISLPNSITTIPEQFLRGSKAIESIVIPNSVTSIEDTAFFECSKLKTITLSSILEDIGVYSFSETAIESIELPNTLTTLGSFAFISCTNLKSIVIPNSVTNIGNNTFQYCTSLSSISLPNTIVRTGSNTFEGTAIKSIVLPASLTRIDNYAFKGCSELSAITLPESVNSLGIGAFENSSKLATINIPQNVTFFNTGVFRGTGFTSFTIPEHVTTINSGVLQNCKNLTSFTFPEHLLEVPQTILKGCSNLTNVTIPDHYTNISNGAFEACSSLQSIKLPSSLSSFGLDSSSFRYCSSLKEINIPESVTRIPSYLFGSCTSLENIILPDNVSTINNNAFDGCTGLKNISFPKNLVTFQGQVFRNCSSLTDISLPLNVASLSNSVFEGCTNLKNVNLESNITNLGNNTFKDCTNLAKVTVNWQNPLAISATVFENVAIENVELKVPNSTASLYQNTAVWQDFGTFTEDDFVPNDNLVVNGSAEITPILENGWTQVSGNWTGLTATSAQDGNNIFFAGANSSAELYQDIDVSSFTGDIDAGIQKFYFSVHLKSFNSFPFDKSQVILEYRDSQENILETYDTELSENVNWFQYQDTRIAPVGTKTIRIKLFSYRVNGSNNDGYIDNVVFRNEGLDVVDIPDANFEQYLLDTSIDTDGVLNGQVFRKDIINVESLDIRSKNITDLTGIESFTALKTLNATNNNIATIDVTNHQLLETLLVSQNQLTNIDLSQNINLKNVNFSNNQFTGFDFNENVNLESINFRNNTISAIDFSTNIMLKELYIDNSELQNIEVSMLTELEILWCFNNLITGLDVSNNTKLKSLDCSDNQISVLNIDKNVALTSLMISRNQLTNLKLLNNASLTTLNCEQNSITYLDVSENEFLSEIKCNDNALIGLNIANGNNAIITNSNFSAFANPNLFCVNVDDEDYSRNNWNQIDMQTEFSTECPELVAIPDSNFETYLESINVGNGVNGDGYVFKAPIEALTSLSIASKNINDTSGIEYFTSLTFLDVADNELTQIDLSKNILLETFLADLNQFTSFNFTQNTKLKTIEARNNLLTTLDLSTLIGLERLELESNEIVTLDLASNSKISILDLKNNQLENLDLSNQPELVIFEANNNLLRFINLKNTANPTVTTLNTTNNPNLTCIEVLNVDYFEAIALAIDAQTKFYENCPSTTAIPDNNFEAYLESINVGNGIVGDNLVLTEAIAALTILNVESQNITDLTGISHFTNLIDLSVKNNNLSQIDISQNKQLEVINLENNELSNIDFSNNFSLKNVNVGDNQITALDVYFLTDLESLQCYKNQITTINLVSNTKLLAFVANENQLQIVDVRANTNLVWLDVDDNDLVSLTVKNHNNTKITQFSATGNSNLTCIEVDDVGYSETNWTQKDVTAIFSADCAPANDDCSFAIPLVFGQETPGDINSGTFTNATDCVAGPIIADVWYTITVPETGEFSIEGGGFGGLLKFAIYESCTSNSALTCGLNISLTNLTPGDVYYLKVWMEGEISNKSAAINSEFGTFTLTANNTSVLSVDSVNEETPILMIFPNPAKEIVSIYLSNNIKIEQVEVYSILGDKVKSEKYIDKSKITFNVSNLSAGIYFIRAKTTKGILSKKLIIK
ncbi:leucine-rich repeat protein [Polaribacter sp. R77954]|uniref:leucine-rich repeat protein n=1 Tax=Polaribacter sp. R77954 TaxID=3093870 RepID=UPI0037C62DF0